MLKVIVSIVYVMFNIEAFVSYWFSFCSDIITHFEHLWAKKQGQDIMKMLQVFHFTLREDLLITVYGKTLKVVSKTT